MCFLLDLLVDEAGPSKYSLQSFFMCVYPVLHNKTLALSPRNHPLALSYDTLNIISGWFTCTTKANKSEELFTILPLPLPYTLQRLGEIRQQIK